MYYIHFLSKIKFFFGRGIHYLDGHKCVITVYYSLFLMIAFWMHTEHSDFQ